MEEFARYQMANYLVNSFDFSKGVNHFEFNTAQGSVTMSHDQEVKVSIHRMLPYGKTSC